MNLARKQKKAIPKLTNICSSYILYIYNILAGSAPS